MGVVSREVAEKEVKNWLDFKKVPPRKRELRESVANIEKLVAAVEDGVLEIDEDTFDITQKLVFPTGVDVKSHTLIHKARIPYSRIQQELKGIATDDIGRFTPAYIAAITGEAKAVIAAMDTEDYAISASIAGFFQ